MSIDFYTNPMSRGQIVRWMLEEVGVPYTQHIIDYSVMGSDSYGAINPMRKVPAIVHDHKLVTECAAICAYLADVFPQAGLGPRDEEKADYYRWLFFAAGPVEQAVTNHANGWDPAPERGRMFGYGSYDRAMETLAAHFEKNEYVCGDRFTAADIYVGSQVLWGTQFETMPKLPAFEAYANRLSGREAYKRGKEIDGKLIAEMQSKQEADA
ncbi:glutathione S-transferase family protein [Sphingomonas sp. HDW15A]|uniref:glutathione S-transferase family protein n=1 Tax=Sphingomonas sp. HDW15A TaxID=2714942 RepID=UPI00140B8C1C|nr:glutathione S-transferase family protein [Sphingomonas sp. HDW15A]QIK95542.1 glutathione S-transferase family protein [Sphingomonas sp. HDW15A]